MVDIKEVKKLAHTFQNGKRSKSECMEMAKKYLENLEGKKEEAFRYSK